jgi:hypothetical protein
VGAGGAPPPPEILAEGEGVAVAILEAAEIFVEEGRSGPGETVDHPLSFPFGFHQTEPFHVKELLGDADLGQAEDLDQLADAQRTFPEEIEDPEPERVAKAFIDLNIFHMWNIPIQEYKCQYPGMTSGLSLGEGASLGSEW